MSLTPLETLAMNQTVALWNTLVKVVGDDRPRDGDLRELAAHIHGIQHAIMSQSLGREMPDSYRLLGRGFPDES